MADGSSIIRQRLREHILSKRTPLQKILRWTVVGATLAAGLHAASAQSVYKCLSPSGKVLYADAACAKHDTASTVSVQPNALGSSEYGDRLLRQEIVTLREQLRAAQQSGAAPQANGTPADTHVQSGPAPLAVDSLACTRAKRDYEVTASSSANTRAIIEAKRTMMYGACGQREPDVQKTVIVRPVSTPPRYGGAYAVFP
jgi:hypothetical protein